MFLSEMQIRNFKNFKKARFKFKSGVNTIIGENDSGKSNALFAIRLLLDKKLNWYEREVSEELFSNSLDLWQGHTIIISLRFSDIGNSEEEAMLKYSTANNIGEGSLTWFCMPNEKTRKLLHDTNNAKGDIQEELKKITIADYTTYISFGAHEDFLDDNIYEKLVGNTSRFDYSEALEEAIMGSTRFEKRSHDIGTFRGNVVDFTFIDALRNAEDDLRQRNNPLMTILTRIGPLIQDSEKKEIKDLVNSINGKISDVEEIKKLSDQVNSKISESVGNTYAPNVSLKSGLSEDVKNLFRELKLKTNNGKEFNLDNMGLGSNNIIYISLKLLEYSYMQKFKGLQEKYFLLLFEEPEAHLHKHIQMSLFQKIGSDNKSYTQIIMTTHSDYISAGSKIGNMNVISIKGNESIVMSPAHGLDDKTIVKIERYLDVKRSSLLFAKNVILVEGDAEEILIPIMVKEVLGITLDEIGISIINIGSVGFKNIYKLFHNDRIQKKCAIITDMDEPIDKDTIDAKSTRAYGLAKTRRNEIDSESENNEWVKGFYAKNTFEVEIVKKNEDYIYKLIDEIYTDETTRIEKKNNINSSDPAKYGNQILKIANKNGKGWTAVSLGVYINHKFDIPQYILDALIFSGRQELKRKNIKTILTHFYRTKNESKLVEAINDDTIEDKRSQLIEIIEATLSKYPDCSVSKLLKGLK